MEVCFSDDINACAIAISGYNSHALVLNYMYAQYYTDDVLI